MRKVAFLILGLLVGVIVMSFAIDPIEPADPESADGAASTRRIVSLSPALTRTLQQLGVADDLVGRSRYCTVDDDSVPIVGDLLSIDYEQLITLQPTHLVIQPPAAGIDRGLIELANENGWAIGSFPSLDTLGAIESMMRRLPTLLEPEGASRDELAARADTEITALRTVIDAPPVTDQRVLLLHALEPIGAFGAQTYLHEILERAGATNPISASGWVTLSREDLVRLDPDAIVLVRGTGGAEVDLAAELDGLDLRAVREGHVAVLRSDDAFLPSPALAEVARQLRSMLQTMAP